MNNWNFLVEMLNAPIGQAAGLLFDGLLSNPDLGRIAWHMLEYALERFKTWRQTISRHRETEILKECSEGEFSMKEGTTTHYPDGRLQHKSREIKGKFRHSRYTEHRDEKN